MNGSWPQSTIDGCVTDESGPGAGGHEWLVLVCLGSIILHTLELEWSKPITYSFSVIVLSDFHETGSNMSQSKSYYYQL